jgi:hypothetical protein
MAGKKPIYFLRMERLTQTQELHQLFPVAALALAGLLLRGRAR